MHANWPTYPREHGWQVFLATIGSFPEGTVFRPIDDIDRCTLFVAENYENRREDFHPRRLHVAAWHEDVLAADDLGLVTGVQALTERGHEERSRSTLRESILDQLEREEGVRPSSFNLDDLGFVHQGEFRRYHWRSLEDYDDDEQDADGNILYEAPRTWLGFSASEGMQMTPHGWRRLESLWIEELGEAPSFHPRVDPIVRLEMYDSALREYGAIIESKMRQICASSKHGQQLIADFIAFTENSNLFLASYIRTLRNEMRSGFAFVRNEFAHGVAAIPRPRTFALLGQMMRILDQLQAISETLRKHSRSALEGDLG
ncbi:hypothetical protein ABZ912_08975 [Nonomuraea angiospora]|uniref:hypothetical protein n=1 Tax=Nonomuraea angiospora TaxID=46172 RepID=UPI003401A6EC